MPTRFIHSRSSLIPSLVMLPFIQCHQTRGLALLGGFWKPRSSGSPGFCAGTAQAPSKAAAKAVKPSSFTLWSIFIFTLQPTDKVIVAPGSSCGAGGCRVCDLKSGDRGMLRIKARRAEENSPRREPWGSREIAKPGHGAKDRGGAILPPPPGGSSALAVGYSLAPSGRPSA